MGEALKQCEAPLKMADYRFGSITLRCQKEPGHYNTRNPHEHAMTACEPPAILVWGE